MKPQPPRQPMWTCGDCGTSNESFRDTCRNCGVRRPNNQADSVPQFRLYTSKESAERIGGNVTASCLDRLAASGAVDSTYMGGRVLWTDAQLAAAVAYHARPAKARDTASPAPRQSSSRSDRLPAGVTQLTAKPGRRYGS